MMTPRIPSRGRVEISEGIAAAVACAISVGLGRRVVIVVDSHDAPAIVLCGLWQ